MMSRIYLFAVSSVAALMIAGAGHAATLTDSYDEWTANVSGSVYNTTALGAEYEQLVTVNLDGGGSFQATDYYSGDPAGEVRTIGSGWGTWAGNYAGQVFYSGDNSNYLTLSLSGLSAFGFEVQPTTQDHAYHVYVTLSSGEVLDDLVSPFGGAQFFGFYGGLVDSLTIQTEDNNFAFGDFVSVPTVSTVPLPAGAPLFGLGLLALAGLGLTTKRRGLAK